MNKETSMKILGVFSWLYFLGCIVFGGIALYMFLQPDNPITNEIAKASAVKEIEGMSLATAVGIVFLLQCFINGLTGFLLRRASKDGKKSTFLIVILIISLISGIINFKSTNILSILIDAFVLFLLFNGRKDTV